MSIASEITRLQNAKASIKTSIENKGVTVPSNTKLDGYSTLVDSIGSSNDLCIKTETMNLIANTTAYSNLTPDAGYTNLIAIFVSDLSGTRNIDPSATSNRVFVSSNQQIGICWASGSGQAEITAIWSR